MSNIVAIHAKTMNTEIDFFNFHRDHPEVYESLVSLARMTKVAGIQKYGIRDLVSVCRWQAKLRNKKFKVRNAFTPYYARLIEAQEPDLDGFFKMSAAACDADLVLVEALSLPTSPITNSLEAAASIFLGRPLRGNNPAVFALK